VCHNRIDPQSQRSKEIDINIRNQRQIQHNNVKMLLLGLESRVNPPSLNK